MPLPSFTMPSLLDVVKGSAVGLACMFTGGAVYINVAEHPARMKVKDVRSMRTQWKESFIRAKRYQGGMAVLATLAGCGACYLDKSDDRWLWLAGAEAIFLVIPYTAFVMKSDINTLLDDNVIDVKGEEWVKENIDTWNRRHIVRSVLGWAAMEIFMYTLIKS